MHFLTVTKGQIEMIEEKSRVPNAKINPAKTRQKLLAVRRANGADTPAGHRCSNLDEIYQVKETATDPEQLRQLAASEARQWRDLERTRS